MTGAAANTDERAHECVERLVAAMTLEEKAGQLVQFFHLSGLDAGEADASGRADQPAMVEAELEKGLVGALLFARRASLINRLQRRTIDGNRHGIPALFGFDVIHGFRTIFPVPIALAASWDPDIIERSQSVAAREARAVGIHWSFAPMCDIARDPRWGRLVESAGEDPVLGAAVAAAQVRGLQGGAQVQPGHVLAGPKHFAGYGFALGGRDYDEVDMSESQLWNVALPPFKAAIDAGAGNVMTAYMDLNGIPATGDPWLLSEVLRDTWGFNGFVVSDAQAVHNLVTHGFAADLADAAARGLDAGCDLEMALFDPAYGHLPDAVRSGLIDEAAVDASVRRVLHAKFALGLFDDPYVDEDAAEDVLADPTHRELACVAAERSMVLLKNIDGTLPLHTSGALRIAVIGPMADSRRDTLGPWVFDHDLDETITILDGIRQRAGDDAEVHYAPGVRPARRLFPSMFDMFPGNTPADPDDFDDDVELQRAVDLAASAGVAIAVIGEWQHMIGESASRSSLDLPGRQLELLQRMHETGTPLVVVVMNGRPLDLRWADENAAAILDAWYPGTSGGRAVASVLFGDVAPAGRLPFTWPRTVGQVPLIYSHTVSHQPDKQSQRYWDIDGTPLYAFGYGLSYTTFTYGEVELDKTSIAPDEELTASVNVTNTGRRDADEVVQLYLHQLHGSASRPIRELKAFRRVHLRAGETARVSFRLGRRQLEYWNTRSRTWVIDPTVFNVGVGGDSNAMLTARFSVRAT